MNLWAIEPQHTTVVIELILMTTQTSGLPATKWLSYTQGKIQKRHKPNQGTVLCSIGPEDLEASFDFASCICMEPATGEKTCGIIVLDKKKALLLSAHFGIDLLKLLIWS